MEKFGIFVWLKGVGIRLVLKEDHYICFCGFKYGYGWLAYAKHIKIAPTNLGVWNDDC
jgi:hypothetical protein